MSYNTIPPDQVEPLKQQSEAEKKKIESVITFTEDEWKRERQKMLFSLGLNVFCIVVLVLGVTFTTGDLSTRFMSLVEIVIGAIFGITATQVAKE